MKSQPKKTSSRQKANSKIVNNKKKVKLDRVLKIGIKKPSTAKLKNSNLKQWMDTELKAACDSVIYKNMSITEAADYFNIPFSKLCFHVREERNSLSKKESIDTASIQANLNETNSEYEDIGDSSNISIRECKNDLVCFASAELSDEDKEVKKIMNGLLSSYSGACKLSMARKSTSPLKLPSYLKNEFNENKYKNDSNKKEASVAEGINSDSEPIDDTDHERIPWLSSYANGVSQVNGNGTIPSTQSVVLYMRDKEIDSSNFTQATANSKRKLLEEFEKPVKIYSYLSLRQKQHPLFLKRNLNYTNKSNRKTSLNSSYDRRGFVFETLYKKIKNVGIQKPTVFDLNFTFGSIELNSLNLFKKIQNIVTTDQSQSLTCKISAFVEVYSIRTNETSNLLARCQCPIKIPNEKNKRTFGYLFESAEQEASIKFRLNPSMFSHVLMKLCLEKFNSSKSSNDHQKDMKPQVKRRKSNKSEPLDNIYENFKVENTDQVQKSNVIQENFIICHLITQQPSLNKIKDFLFLNLIQTDALYDLKLENDSKYVLRTSKATDKDKKIFDQFYFNFEQSIQISVKKNTLLKSENKRTPIIRNHFFTNTTKQVFCETVEDLIDQFQESNSLNLIFSTELKEVFMDKQSPMNSYAVVDHVLSPPTPVLSMKMLFNNDSKKNKLRKKRTFCAIQPDLTNKNMLNTEILNPISKIADQPVVYQFNSKKSNTKNNATNSKAPKINISNADKLLTLSNNLTCPFCYLNWKKVKCLFVHLQMCHFRFHTTEQHYGTLVNIEDSELKNKKLQFNIWCDDIYDGSYLGNPYDLQNYLHLGYSGCRLKPTRRSPVTYILVNKKSNFIDVKHFDNLDSTEIEAIKFIQQQQQQQLVAMQSNNLYNVQAGIERLFYHTTTTLPILVNEIENDSDNDLDPEWLKDHTTLLINDFNDVNEGEKGIMLLWNLHLLKNNYVADSQVYSACQKFIREETRKMVELNLTNNFLLHLANLHDYGMLTPKELLNLIDFLNQLKAETG